MGAIRRPFDLSFQALDFGRKVIVFARQEADAYAVEVDPFGRQDRPQARCPLTGFPRGIAHDRRHVRKQRVAVRNVPPVAQRPRRQADVISRARCPPDPP